MRYIKNEKGIALVTSLMFTALSLVITMTLLYMVMGGIRSSGAMKRYKTTTEAAYGGVEIMLKDVLSKSLSDGLLSDVTFKSNMENHLRLLSSVVVSDCLRIKTMNPNSKWPANCSDNSLDASKSADVQFVLNPVSGMPFTVYSKIVDTTEYKLPVFQNKSTATGRNTMTLEYTSIAGNSDRSSLDLEGGAVVDSGGAMYAGGDTNPHRPYRYRIEVRAERAQNASEKSKISVEYVY